MRRVWWSVCLIVLPAVAAGCLAECFVKHDPTELVIDAAAEEVRTLPVIDSGHTSIAGIQIPDSHGLFRYNLTLSKTVPRADVTRLTLAVQVAGHDVPLKITRIDSGVSTWQSVGGGWQGAIRNGSALAIWWTVDRSLATSPTELMLTEGASYQQRLQFHWEAPPCTTDAAGDVDSSSTGFVRASLVTTTFAKSANPTIRHGAAMGFSATYHVTNGITAVLDRTRATIVYLPAGPGAPGVAYFSDLAATVDGQAATQVAPGKTLTLASKADLPLLPAGTLASHGLYILLVEVTEHPSDATAGNRVDLLGHGLAA
jgi:hypothetical protein